MFHQRDYFLYAPQTLLRFMRGATFRARATELGGYDIDTAGEVQWVN